MVGLSHDGRGRRGSLSFVLKHRIIVGLIAMALLVSWLVWAYKPHHIPGPPTATFVSAEPSGITDDSGAELQLITFTVTNTNQLEGASNRYSNIIWVRDSTKPTEARIQHRWSAAPAANARSTRSTLLAGQETQSILLAPVGTDCCRVWLQYAGVRTTYPATLKGISLSLVTKLPLSVRSQISYKFWRWAGFAGTEPDPKWIEICVEFPVSPAL